MFIDIDNVLVNVNHIVSFYPCGESVGVQLSTGEHIYTRMSVRQLQDKINYLSKST